MSLFVNTENQKLLWNVIGKNKMVNDYFMFYPREKDGWFRSIVQSFYEKNKNRTLNPTELLLLNKETISHMIQSIKDKFPTQVEEKPPIQQNFLKSYSVTENKVEKIGTQFTEKQLEYNSLFEKKIPESIEFSEKQDGPLQNMDELIKKHMQDREYELKKYAPLPLVSPPEQVQTIQPNKLKINNSIENINIQIEDLPSAIKKSVSWSDEATSEKIEKQQLEIEELKKQISILIDKVKNLEETKKTE
jgi:hypothetical protein